MDDPADLDGDDRFYGYDLSVLGDERERRQPSNNSGGCCVLIFVLGSMLGAGWWGVSNYLA
jgi:hypothetical protein